MNNVIYDDVSEEEPVLEMDPEEYEQLKQAYQNEIDAADAVNRLYDNKDFQNLILQKYLVDQPKNLGLLIASGRMTEKGNEDAFKDLIGTGNLNTFLQSFAEKGRISREALSDLEKSWEVYLAETV